MLKRKSPPPLPANMLLIVAPNYYTPSSNGHLVSAKIWDALIARLGASIVRIISGEESIESINFYKERFGSSYSTESEFIASKWMETGRSFHLLLPDDAEGTRSALVGPLKDHSCCKRIYIIAYAPMLVFAPIDRDDFFSTYDDRHRVIFFDKWIMPRSLREAQAIDIYQEPDPPAELLHAMQARGCHFPEMPKPRLAIYAGKGVYRLSSRNKETFRIVLDIFESRGAAVELITRFSPSSKQALYDLLSKCSLLVCLDPFSNIEREAVLLGCRVWKPNPGQTGHIPGIYYGEISNSQVQRLASNPRAMSEGESTIYHEYSKLLQQSSATRLKILTRVIERDMNGAGDTGLSRKAGSLLADKLMHCLTDELKTGVLELKSAYAPYIHPMQRIPELNNSLKLESAINLLLGVANSLDELEYERLCLISADKY